MVRSADKDASVAANNTCVAAKDVCVDAKFVAMVWNTDARLPEAIAVEVMITVLVSATLTELTALTPNV